MRAFLILFLGAFLTLGVIGCTSYDLGEPPADRYERSHHNFESQVKIPYYSAAMETKVTQKTWKLRVGMTPEEVIAIFGQPHVSQAYSRPRGSEGKYVGFRWSYYISYLPVEVSNSIANRYLTIFFDLDYQLRSYNSSSRLEFQPTDDAPR